MKIMTQVKRFGAKPAVFGAAVMTASGFALADSAEAVSSARPSALRHYGYPPGY